MPELFLRSIDKDDYIVVDTGVGVGRIRFASERRPQCWMWSITIPVPGVTNGTSDSLDLAKDAFRKSWLPFKERIGEADYAAAIETMESARNKGKK